MRHAAHKAARVSDERFSAAKALFTSSRGSHTAKAVRMVQLANGGGAVVGLDPAVAEKLNATVADMRFVKPIDEELIVRLAQSHDYIVTAEENAEQGGAGSAVLEVLAKHGICKPVLLLGVADTVTEHGDPKKLLDDLGLSADAMEKRIRGWLPAA